MSGRYGSAGISGRRMSALHMAFTFPSENMTPGQRTMWGLACGPTNSWVNAAYYFDEQKGTALTVAGTYEIHHEKEDVDITPGSHFTLNYGISQYLPINDKFLSEVGIAGFAQW